jgi:hypothetical protein
MPLNAIIYHILPYILARFLPTLNRPLVVSCQLLVAPGPGGPGGPSGPGPGSCRYAGARRA